MEDNIVIALGGDTVNYFYDNAEDLLSKLSSLQKKGDFVYRGYSKQEEVTPTIMRNKQYILKEKNFLYDFEYYGKNYINATDAIDFMSYGQHYGLKTRLLDFSYNPYVALFFALHGKKTGLKGNDGEFYRLICCNISDNLLVKDIDLLTDVNGNRIEKRNSLALQSIQLINYIESIYADNTILTSRNLHNFLGYKFYESDLYFTELQKKIENKRLLFIDHDLNNQRIIMQQGLFMFPYTLQENTYKDMLYKNSFIITIPRKLRNELLLILDGLGFNMYKLMPDLASICDEITIRADKDTRDL